MFERKCPKCDRTITYKSKQRFKESSLANCKCKKCAGLERMQRPELIANLKEKNSGKNNPMFGKTFYEIWVEKHGKTEADRLLLEHSKNSARIGKNNPMFGKTFYDAWKESGFSEQEIKEKAKHMSAKLSARSSGKNNPMFGKPSPKKSGNGWKGTFKSFFFRSLLELSYLLQMSKDGKRVESGESTKHRISYVIDGLSRNYFPDFFLPDENIYVEIKPSSLVSSRVNVAKFKALTESGNKLIVITEKDLHPITSQLLEEMISKGDIELTDSTKVKFEKWKSQRTN